MRFDSLNQISLQDLAVQILAALFFLSVMNVDECMPEGIVNGYQSISLFDHLEWEAAVSVTMCSSHAKALQEE